MDRGAWRATVHSFAKLDTTEQLTLSLSFCICKGFPSGSVGKESACNAGVPSLIPGLEGSPGEGNSNPLQYSCLRNPMDRGAWQATVHGVATIGHNLATKPPTRHHHHHICNSLPAILKSKNSLAVNSDLIFIVFIPLYTFCRINICVFSATNYALA